MDKTYTLTFPGPDDGQPCEYDVRFQITADMSYDPGNVSGPPERCYPPDSSCEITEIKPLTTLDGMRDVDLINALNEQIGEDKLMEDLWEDWQADKDDAEQQYADYVNDQRLLERMEAESDMPDHKRSDYAERVADAADYARKALRENGS